MVPDVAPMAIVRPRSSLRPLAVPATFSDSVPEAVSAVETQTAAALFAAARTETVTSADTQTAGAIFAASASDALTASDASNATITFGVLPGNAGGSSVAFLTAGIRRRTFNVETRERLAVVERQNVQHLVPVVWEDLSPDDEAGLLLLMEMMS